MFRHKDMELQSPQILCAHKPYFLMPGHVLPSLKICIDHTQTVAKCIAM